MKLLELIEQERRVNAARMLTRAYGKGGRAVVLSCRVGRKRSSSTRVVDGYTASQQKGENHGLEMLMFSI